VKNGNHSALKSDARGDARRLSRPPHFGVLWIAFAPIVFLMAAIAKVESDLTYMIHLVGFTAVAVAAVVCGVGALLRHRWGGVGLRWISMLAATYYLVMAGLGILWPSQWAHWDG
jgi:hypothetical protein